MVYWDLKNVKSVKFTVPDNSICNTIDFNKQIYVQPQYCSCNPDLQHQLWPAMEKPTTRDFSWKSRFGYRSTQNLL